MDLLAAPVAPSIDRAKILDFTTSFSEDHAGCLIPAPEEEQGTLTAVFRPYQYQVHLILNQI